MAEDTTTDPTPCSVCDGQWLRDLLYQHRVNCPRYAADTATIAADDQRHNGIRIPTDTELETINEQGYEQPETGERFYIRFSHEGGWHEREVLIGAGALAELDGDEPGPGGLVGYWHPSGRVAERRA